MSEIQPRKSSNKWLLPTYFLFFFWPLVFEYLEQEDLVSVASRCALHGGDLYFKNESRLHKCFSSFWFGRHRLLRLFTSLQVINLSNTPISSRNFFKFVSAARQLRELNIEGCKKISESAFLEAKPSIRRLFACLCSINLLQEICARGIHLQFRELLFLSKFNFQRPSHDLEMV